MMDENKRSGEKSDTMKQHRQNDMEANNPPLFLQEDELQESNESSAFPSRNTNYQRPQFVDLDNMIYSLAQQPEDLSRSTMMSVTPLPKQKENVQTPHSPNTSYILNQNELSASKQELDQVLEHVSVTSHEKLEKSFENKPEEHSSSEEVTQLALTEEKAEEPASTKEDFVEKTDVGVILDGRYKLTKRIAKGGMGVVFEALHTKLDKKVAIKVISPDAVSDPETQQRFFQEAKMSTMLKSPHTVRVFDFSTSQREEPYFAMEYISGNDLRETLAREGAFPIERTIHITKQIAQSLIEAHELGMIHRDLKPSNVMLTQFRTQEDFVKIFDFGIAKLSSQENDGFTQQGMVLGTPRYMAPEQIRNPGDVDQKADIYSLGLLMFAMLVGQEPFSGYKQDNVLWYDRMRGKDIALPKDLKVSRPIRSLFEKMVAPNPHQRPTAEDTFYQLEEIEKNLIVKQHSGTFSRSLTRAEKAIFPEETKSSKKWLAVFVVLLLLGGAGWWLSKTHKPSTNPTTTPTSTAGTTTPTTPPAQPKQEVPAKVARSKSKPDKPIAPIKVAKPRIAPQPQSTKQPTRTKPVAPVALPKKRRVPKKRKPKRYSRLLRLTSTPSNASVYSLNNGKFLGKTPLRLRINARFRAFRVKKQGYFSRKVIIPRKSKQTRRNIALKPITIEIP
jgi:serine/threonine protein kinase